MHHADLLQIRALNFAKAFLYKQLEYPLTIGVNVVSLASNSDTRQWVHVPMLQALCSATGTLQSMPNPVSPWPFPPSIGSFTTVHVSFVGANPQDWHHLPEPLPVMTWSPECDISCTVCLCLTWVRKAVSYLPKDCPEALAPA